MRLAPGARRYLCEVSAGPSAPTLSPAPPSAEAAEAAIARLVEIASPRGAVLLGPDDEALAATGERLAWAEAGRRLFAAADGAGPEPAARVHVATEDGEAFALREGGLALVVATARFPLASLTFSDMRAVLRELRSGAPG